MDNSTTTIASDPDDDVATLTRLAIAGELAAGAVHETRNLVTAILGFAQMGRRRPDDQRALVRYLELIERESLRSIEVLDHFLGIAAPTSSAIARFDVAAVLGQIHTGFALRPDDATITLEVDAAPGELIAIGRSGELEQVLYNLVLNAIASMPEEGTVRLTASRTADAIVIVVADDGPGVPADLRQRIFEPFFTTRGARGTGLGLALCVRMLAEVGGSVALEDAAVGARFVVRLPAGDPR